MGQPLGRGLLHVVDYWIGADFCISRGTYCVIGQLGDVNMGEVYITHARGLSVVGFNPAAKAIECQQSLAPCVRRSPYHTPLMSRNCLAGAR